MSSVDSIISINLVFYLIGAIAMLVAGMSWRDATNPKRYSTALFWFLFGFSFLFGDLMLSLLGKQVTYRIVGVMVLLIAALAGAKLLGVGVPPPEDEAERQRSAQRLGNRLFLPALAIPLITVLLTLFAKELKFGSWFLLDQKNLTLAALTIACLGALLLGSKLTGGSPLLAVRESRRLVDAIGWALLLPQMLAMLGGVFVAAQTGRSIQAIVNLFIDPDNRLALVAIYCVGMALFTMIMGNAFAAFPVMTAGIALPFLIVQHHANPAPLVAIGMFSGYCGTLMTPMAANFNIVPAALLELKDKYQVIKIQIPSALAVLACNILLMYFLVFP
ncbi:DUF979 domain-containing protein [Undibacterium sp.]|uniref:DUF979 domain-containing protein n=1 Tax=Undibacterium sp. TaxID=1914977 RepID=UPI0025FC9780|nr:DUF979 domain-containing protein [Undibacterium sp.]